MNVSLKASLKVLAVVLASQLLVSYSWILAGLLGWPLGRWSPGREVLAAWFAACIIASLVSLSWASTVMKPEFQLAKIARSLQFCGVAGHFFLYVIVVSYFDVLRPDAKSAGDLAAVSSLSCLAVSPGIVSALAVVVESLGWTTVRSGDENS